MGEKGLELFLSNVGKEEEDSSTSSEHPPVSHPRINLKSESLEINPARTLIEELIEKQKEVLESNRKVIEVVSAALEQIKDLPKASQLSTFIRPTVLPLA